VLYTGKFGETLSPLRWFCKIIPYYAHMHYINIKVFEFLCFKTTRVDQKGNLVLPRTGLVNVDYEIVS
jgi:hypothetical protein